MRCPGGKGGRQRAGRDVLLAVSLLTNSMGVEGTASAPDRTGDITAQWRPRAMAQALKGNAQQSRQHRRRGEPSKITRPRASNAA